MCVLLIQICKAEAALIETFSHKLNILQYTYTHIYKLPFLVGRAGGLIKKYCYFHFLKALVFIELI